MKTPFKLTFIAVAVSAAMSGYAEDDVAAVQSQNLPTVNVIGQRLDAPVSSEARGGYIHTRGKTATGMTLSEKETPQSTITVTRQKMDDQKSETLRDTLQNTNGITVQAIDRGRNYIFSRGFAIDRYQVDGANVVFDNQWIAGEQLNNMAVYDRVEVVRGATGLTTGSGEPSARVNLIRKHADSKTRRTVLEGGLQYPWGYTATIDHSQPLNSDGSVRSRFVISHGDNKTTFDREKVGQTTLYGVLDADLTDKASMSFGLKHGINRQKALLWGGLPIADANNKIIDWNKKTNSAPDWSYWDSKGSEVFTNWKYKFNNDWNVELNGNYARNTSDSELFYASGKVDGNTLTGVWPGKFEVVSKQGSLGANLNGAYPLLGRKHKLVAGLSYTRSAYTADAADGTTFQADTDIRNFNAYPEPNWGGMKQQYDSTAKEVGAFAATQLNLHDRFKVVLGTRFANAKRDRLYYGAASKFRSGSVWLPYAGATFDVTPNHSLYAGYTDIFKPQEHQDVNGNYLDPVKGKNYEIGLKSRFMDERLTGQLSVFRIEQDNLAVKDGVKVRNNPLADAYHAEKGTVSKGFELDVTGNITPNWHVSAGYALARAKNSKGENLNNHIPKQTFKLFTTYDFGGTLKGLTVGGGVNWYGSSFVSVGNDKVTRKKFAIADLMARYRVNDQLSLQVNAHNLFDKRPYNMFGSSQVNYWDGRSVKASLKYEF
ncbi:TonB-dependent siderophore receptor [Neisseria chenwenguii]|uniref:TonB-dependent siderophore receptor n=1 Tax=Neisseria chenwenguii TaxID=1853278 RepID=UPI000F504400|nr:TonB-dependent siderophore receptor [Neisseria chenwenguii]ROV57244.1 TonB-dependent siderophore receptor [Neisseria chenwenguii]